MKLKINEVIEDVRDELLCYEEGEAVVDSWEKEFREWIEKNKGKHKDIVADKNGVFLKIKDEEEIFEIADSYLEAIAYGSIYLCTGIHLLTDFLFQCFPLFPIFIYI